MLVYLSDLGDRVRGMVLEARRSSLGNFVANEGPYIDEDLVLIKIFKVKVVKRGVSHSEFRMLEAYNTNLERRHNDHYRKIKPKH